MYILEFKYWNNWLLSHLLHLYSVYIIGISDFEKFPPICSRHYISIYLGVKFFVSFSSQNHYQLLLILTKYHWNQCTSLCIIIWKAEWQGDLLSYSFFRWQQQVWLGQSEADRISRRSLHCTRQDSAGRHSFMWCKHFKWQLNPVQPCHIF